MKNLIKNITLLILISFFTACGEEKVEEMPEETGGKYESGVFVINQGKFGDGTGTISFFDRDTTVLQNIYQTENPGKVLGNIAQSMHIANGKAYIAVNNAGKIEVVNNEDFTSIATIEGLSQVRYISSSSDNTVFATTWGSDGVSGVLFEIDSTTDMVFDSLALGGGLERIIREGDNLYVPKSGGFGTDSIVYQISATNPSITEEFIVGDNPVDIVYDNQDIYLLCTGAFDFSDPTNNTAGGIYILQQSGFELVSEVANGSNSLIANRFDNVLYYLDFEGIKEVAPSSGSSSLFAAGNFYALGFDPVEKLIYAADAKDFASNGEVLVFNTNGEEVNRFEAGIIPGNFYFTD